MGKRVHRRCVYRSVRMLDEKDGRPPVAYCTAMGGGSSAWSKCTYCRDEIPNAPFKKPKPPRRTA